MPKNASIVQSKFTATSTAKSLPGSLPKGKSAKILTTPPQGDLRQRFINYLTLRQHAYRTVQSDTGWIYQLARFHRRSPDLLGNEEIQAWLLHLIAKPYSASSINLAINVVRSFHGGMLGLDVEPLLKGIKRPKRRTQPPEVSSPEEVERLVTQGTNGDPLGRAFLMTVYGYGLRLSDAPDQ